MEKQCAGQKDILKIEKMEESETGTHCMHYIAGKIHYINDCFDTVVRTTA